MSAALSAMLVVESPREHAGNLRDNLLRSCLCDRIVHFSNGKDLLDFLLATRPDQPRWDFLQIVIVINRVSKEIDAYEILRQLKNNKDLSCIPVVIFAEASDDNDVAAFYQAGCSFYMCKPSDYNSLMAYVDAIGFIFSMPQTRLPLISKHHQQSVV